MNKSKKTKIICFFLALLFVFAQGLASCSPREESKWNKIKDSGSIEDLLDFDANLKAKSGSLYDEVNEKIAEKINAEENPEKLTALLNLYPEKENILKDRISELQKIACFNAAKEQKSIELFEEFIRLYGDGDSVRAEEAAAFIEEIKENTDWTEALEKHMAENSLLPLIDYAGSHPGSIYFSDAEQLIKQIQNDSSYSEKFFGEPDLDSLDGFIENFPGHKDTEKALELREDFIGDIFSMIQKEYIETVATGDSIAQSNLMFVNHTKSRLEVTVPLGTYLAANSGYVHNMIVREEITFSAEPKKYESIYIKTASMNIYKDIPDDTSYFTVSRLEDASPLVKLIKILNENGSSYEVAQAAIWYMTDNPGKDKLLGALVYEDGKKAITEEDYIEVLRLIELVSK